MSSIQTKSRDNLITYLRCLTASQKFKDSKISITKVVRPTDNRKIGRVELTKSIIRNDGNIEAITQTVYMGKLKDDGYWRTERPMSYKYAMDEGYGKNAKYLNSVSNAVSVSIDKVEDKIANYERIDRENLVRRYKAKALWNLFDKTSDDWYDEDYEFDKDMNDKLLRKLDRDPVLFVDWSIATRKSIGRHRFWTIECEREPVNGEPRFTIRIGQRYDHNRPYLFTSISGAQVKRAISLELHMLNMFCSGKNAHKVESSVLSEFPDTLPTITGGYHRYDSDQVEFKISKSDTIRFIMEKRDGYLHHVETSQEDIEMDAEFHEEEE
jgi:hypothetical protein